MMSEAGGERVDGPAQELARFRAGHLERRLVVRGVTWTYYLSGDGPQVMLFLPGGTGQADAAFESITELEARASVLAITYPPVPTLHDLIEGILAILDAHAIGTANVWGNAFGGMVGQLLVRRSPERVSALVLSNTVGPDPASATAERRQRRFLSLLPSPIARWMIGRTLRTALAGLDEGSRVFWHRYFRETLLPHAKERLLAVSRLTAEFHSLTDLAADDIESWRGRMLILAPADADDGSHRDGTLRKLYPRATFGTVPLARPGTDWNLAYARRVVDFFAAYAGGIQRPGSHELRHDAGRDGVLLA